MAASVYHLTLLLKITTSTCFQGESNGFESIRFLKAVFDVFFWLLISGPNIQSSGQCLRPCPRTYTPVCGSDDITYPNLCALENAQCSDESLTLKSNSKCEKNCEGPDCESRQECPRGVPIVNCLRNPCEYTTCRRYPQAKCKANYCGGCNAIFYVGERIVECGNSECPVGVPLVNCVKNPCSNAKCPAHSNAKCIPSFCGGCNAEFFLSSRRVYCSKQKCEKEGEKIFAANSGRVLLGQYRPQCDEEGNYKSMQCHEGYCWCVDTESGVELIKKGDKKGFVDCGNLVKIKAIAAAAATAARQRLEGAPSVKTVGYIKFDPSTISSLATGSCLNLVVRRSQYPDILAKKKIQNLRELIIRNGKMRYAISIPNAKPGNYEIEAILNRGWCKREETGNYEWIKNGDYYTKTAEILTIREGNTRKVLRKDVTAQQIDTVSTVRNQGKRLLFMYQEIPVFHKQSVKLNFLKSVDLKTRENAKGCQ